MAFPVSWRDPRYLLTVAGVLAVGVLAVLLRATGQFSTLSFGVGVLGVTLVSAGAMALSRRIG
ncbi:hypothetical protein [Halomarina oriensis]|uniref:Transporter n=1 Tax=Halomarina oriensis TaxID=671145 RepID=A0A6B0GP90_9EURY|nr:hypothetical protein [Halomarina oriensis]MWG36632.1 hypothetical protein [Halomarina oriensis]